MLDDDYDGDDGVVDDDVYDHDNLHDDENDDDVAMLRTSFCIHAFREYQPTTREKYAHRRNGKHSHFVTASATLQNDCPDAVVWSTHSPASFRVLTLSSSVDSSAVAYPRCTLQISLMVIATM